MKREDLEKIEGLTKEQIDAVMKLHGADAEKNKSKLQAETDKYNDAKKKVDELSEVVKKYDGVDVEGLKNKASEWEKKYNNDMANKDKEFAMERYFDNIEFSSSYAKQAVMAEFKSKDFKFENGKFLGADDYINNLKESNADAFKKAVEPNIQTGLEHLGGAESLSDVEKAFYELNPDLKP